MHSQDRIYQWVNLSEDHLRRFKRTVGRFDKRIRTYRPEHDADYLSRRAYTGYAPSPLTAVKKKVVFSCGPPGSGKNTHGTYATVDFDAIATWLCEQIRSDVPHYLMSDYSPFRQYARVVEQGMITRLCSPDSALHTDTTIYTCHIQSKFLFIMGLVERFEVLIHINFYDMPPYTLWRQIQKQRELEGRVNYRDPGKRHYDKLYREGEITWDRISRIAELFPEIWVTRTGWSSTYCSDNKHLQRPGYVLMSKRQMELPVKTHWG